MQIFEDNPNQFSSFCPKAATGDLVVQYTGDELLVYDLEANRAVCLNNTSRLVWHYCDGKTETSAIREKLEKKLGATISNDFVLFALTQLKEEGLISNGDLIPDGFAGLTRREVVKKIGFASMVALPIVSSIVAPQPTFAQSCVNPGGGAEGTTGTNPTTCAPSADACVPTCTTGFFVEGCCSGMGVVGPCVPFGEPPSVNCTCLCA